MNVQTIDMMEDGNYLINKAIDTGEDRQMVVPVSNPRGMRKVQAWIDAGNTPDPYVPPVPTYTELRAKAYPRLQDQLDALWKGGQPEADMKLIIDGVKATHPKV